MEFKLTLGDKEHFDDGERLVWALNTDLSAISPVFLVKRKKVV
jgi:hypothetical protein